MQYGTTRDFADLVEELDIRVPRDDIEVIPDPLPRRRIMRAVPVWLALAVCVVVLVAGGWSILKPTKSTCEFSETVCAIEDLDIDALLAVVPDAELFARLPSIHELDPDDTLTAGDVFRLEQFEGVDPLTLISPSQLERFFDN